MLIVNKMFPLQRLTLIDIFLIGLPDINLEISITIPTRTVQCNDICLVLQ